MGFPEQVPPVTRATYFEDYCPFAGGLLVVNAIGTQMRDPISPRLI